MFSRKKTHTAIYVATRRQLQHHLPRFSYIQGQTACFSRGNGAFSHSHRPHCRSSSDVSLRSAHVTGSEDSAPIDPAPTDRFCRMVRRRIRTTRTRRMTDTCIASTRRLVRTRSVRIRRAVRNQNGSEGSEVGSLSGVRKYASGRHGPSFFKMYSIDWSARSSD